VPPASSPWSRCGTNDAVPVVTLVPLVGTHALLAETTTLRCVGLSTVIVCTTASLVPNPTAWPSWIRAYGSGPTFQIFTLLFADVMKYRPSGVNSIPCDRLALSRWFRGT
jgi:hypothetical protein